MIQWPDKTRAFVLEIHGGWVGHTEVSIDRIGLVERLIGTKAAIVIERRRRSSSILGAKASRMQPYSLRITLTYFLKVAQMPGLIDRFARARATKPLIDILLVRFIRRFLQRHGDRLDDETSQ